MSGKRSISPFPWKSRFYLVDEKGVYITHPDPAKTFGSDLGHDANLRTEKPLTWKALNALEPDAGRTLTGEMEVAGDAILFTGWFQVGGAWPQRWIGVAVEVEKSAIFGNLDRGYVYLLFAAPGALFIGILMIWALSRRFAQPLADLSAAMTAYGRGEPIGDPPVRSKDETGRIARSFAAMRERIDDRTNELERTRDRLREAQKLAKVGQWELDLANDQLEWSPGVYGIFEIDSDKFEATYDAFLDAIHPDDRDKVSDAYANSLKTKTPYRVYHRLLMKDGRVKYMREACRHEWGENGAPVRSIGIVQDITELKEVEDALRESEARFRGLVENSSDWIWEVDASGRYTYCSPGAKAILGYEPSEMLGKEILGSGG